MITVVTEDNRPLGTLKRGKPRKGDNIFVEGASYEVVDRDRDSVIVRQQVQFEYPRQQNRYADNSPLDNVGYRSNVDKPELPFKKYTDAPVFPTELTRPPTGTPQSRPGVPHWTSKPVSEQPLPYSAPSIWHVIHYKYFIPLYTVEHMHQPRVGQVEDLGGEQYTYVKIEGDNIFVRPVRSWNYAVLALDKDNGSPLIFVPVTHKHEISNIKFRVNQYLQKQQGVMRRQYHLKAIPLHHITRYMSNPGRRLPRLRK